MAQRMHTIFEGVTWLVMLIGMMVKVISIGEINWEEERVEESRLLMLTGKLRIRRSVSSLNAARLWRKTLR